jgi:hypothetical protein
MGEHPGAGADGTVGGDGLPYAAFTYPRDSPFHNVPNPVGDAKIPRADWLRDGHSCCEFLEPPSEP